ncbi:uncharacterized protein DNG_03602 [Cephalotrichum gorgonifer]|uniref:PWWP domain-containing protein n=1 Tax=Cephalotrichum gorgonifer TaxID=2041049 RepID=A0AAE8STT0_9PEZI|nr:uncharacterized protein DNG_03602 [Cephalotrichum gorgonifer]
MSSTDQTIEKDVATTTAPATDAPDAPAPQADKEEAKEAQPGDKGEVSEAEKAADATESEAKPEKSNEKTDEPADVEMKDTTEEKGEEAAADKAKAPRRKSTGGAESKGKKLNKKQSKARILNLSAKPGDHYLVKLKGFPPWPAVICDEDMLPGPIIASRPVTAIRADGTYREDFGDGGKRAGDRTYPVMYLYTNEFGWVPNTSLQELSPEQASEAINDKMRKDLQSAYELASEGHDLDFYKEVLQQFQEELVAKEEAQKAKKKKAAAAAADEMDIDAVDKTPAKKSKKRKAEDEVATPQRSDSVKKPKIKLTGSSAKAAANGAATPKATKDQGAAKSASKSKSKKPAEKLAAAVAKKPELTAEERHERKVKEVYYLRHKLQKGLFPKEGEPKAEDMPGMAEFFTRLEEFTEMDADILRATRIHKLPKAIMRLEAIPREAEFNFKSRSTGLLERWNKILGDAPAAAAASTGANGTGEAKEKGDGKAGSNGTEAKGEVKTAPADQTESEEEGTKDNAEEKVEAGSEENQAPVAVEASA